MGVPPDPGAVLVLHAAGAFCAARVEAGPLCAERAEPMARGHAEALPGVVASVMEEIALKPRDLSVVAACVGPGSFAGARVGVAFARGLALAAGLRAIGINDLDALALDADPERVLEVFCVHDAKRGDAVWRRYASGAPAGDITRGRMEVAEAEAREAGPNVLAGSGAVALSEAAPDARIVSSPRPPLAAMCELARAAPAGAGPPAPFYARKPDAALPADAARR